MILLRNFNRQYSIIRLPQFGQPMIANINALELPRNSIYHYLPGAVSEIGPSQTQPIIAKAEKLCQINHVLKLPDNVNGRPIAVPQNIEKEILIYHRQNRRLARHREETIVLRDERTLFIENYAALTRLYRYTQTQLSWYDRQMNIYKAMISRLSYDTERFTNRQNYVMLELPNIIPPIAAMQRAERVRTSTSLKLFKTDEQIRLLDLWTWMSENRDASELGKLNDEQLKRVNIILTYKGKFINLNLGELNHWRKGRYNLNAPLSPIQMQKRLYVSIIRLAEAGAANQATEHQQELLNKAIEAAEGADVDTAVRDELVASANNALGEGDPSQDVPVLDTNDPDAVAEEVAKYDNLELDEENSFEIIASKADVVDVSHYDFYRPLTHEEGVMRECERYINSGQLTTRDYQRAQSTASNWRLIKAPNGQALEEFIKTTPEQLKVEPETVAEDLPTVYDKSIAKTTLKPLSRKYNTEVLARDIAACSVSLQKAGFIVMDYNTERVVDAANCLDIHTIKVSTVLGKESTLRFTLPAVDERGYWKANDVNYGFRKQRVDFK